MRPRAQWEIPPRLWAFFASLVVAMGLIFAGLLLNQWLDQRETKRELRNLRNAVCGVVEALSGGPTPPPGPIGDRARALIPKMEALENASCDRRDP